MDAMDLTFEQLNDRSPASAPQDVRYVPIVKQVTAIEKGFISTDLVVRKSVITISAIEAESLGELTTRLGWDRFVAVTATRAQAAFMYPVISEGATVVVDRYFQQFDPALEARRLIYAIADGKFLIIGYLQQIGKQLQLLPDANSALPKAITLGPLGKAPHHIVGCVVMIVHHSLGRSARSKY